MPDLLCRDFKESAHIGQDLKPNDYSGNIRVKLYNLYFKARAAHSVWKLYDLNSSLISNNSANLNAAVASYYDFLRFASKWLSHRATDKPISLILTGAIILIVSTFLLLHLLFLQFKDHDFERKFKSSLKSNNYIWNLDEAFVFFGAVLHVSSLGASSMVEEEQYTWHFLTSTLCLILLYMTILSFVKEQKAISFEMKREEKNDLYQSQIKSCKASKYITHVNSIKLCAYDQICYMMIVLIFGRILRGWHQGGVNWVHLPDISKWLDQASSSIMKALEITSLLLIMILSVFSLSLLKSRPKFVFIASFSVQVLGFLVLLHIMENQFIIRFSSIAQIFYISSGIIVFGTFILSPWIFPLHNILMKKKSSNSHSGAVKLDAVLLAIHESLFLSGVMYVSSWCLLQLLLQQPVNAIPILLVFGQIIACIIYFSGQHHHQFVEVAAIYFLGMAGHFSLGNSNTLATIDVAGAYNGISSRSVVFPGILMFIITFSSPILSSLSMVVNISMKDIVSFLPSDIQDLSHALKLMIIFPCLVPLVLNSAILTTFTIILLLMRNHLFIWSVFSPKYLYLCAGTLSIYIGLLVITVTVIYTCTVLFFRADMIKSRD